MLYMYNVLYISRREYRTFLEDQKIFSSRKLSEQTAEHYRKDRTRTVPFTDCTLPQESKPIQTKPTQTHRTNFPDRSMTLLKTNPPRQWKIKNQRCWPPWEFLTRNQTIPYHTIPYHTIPNQTKPSQAKPNQTKPTQTRLFGSMSSM